ncbi:molybdate ABC transporter substrate-binding protein [Chloroflexia bacterium SDU3-3]|nr:molybdate ABC transporter substrate-binding protein [Chloroflexia bacterium SDU3-3]
MSWVRRCSTLALLMVLCACAAQPSATAPVVEATAKPTAAPIPTFALPTAEAATAEAAASAPGDHVTLNVFAAASLTESFGDIGKKFEQAHPGVTVVFNFAGSQQLAQQIAQGAPVDVFASANTAQMKNVITAGQVISGTQQTFVRNRLVLITPKESSAGVAALADLARPGLKLILADRSVPVGQYALDVFAKASKLPEYTEAFSPTVLANVVSYEENVRAVLSKIALGEGDAGIVYTTDIVGDAADKVARIEIPDDLNTIATYPIATVKDAANADLAQQFVAYVLSQEGQGILAGYGFIPAAKP